MRQEKQQTMIEDGIHAATFLNLETLQTTCRTKQKDKFCWWFRLRSTGETFIGRKTGTQQIDADTASGRLMHQLMIAVDGKAQPLSQFAAILYEGSKVRVLIEDNWVREIFPATALTIRKQ